MLAKFFQQEPQNITEEPDAKPGPLAALADALGQSMKVDPKEVRRKNTEIHKDWNRINALVNELCYGNFEVKASLFHHAHGLVADIVDLIEDYRDRLATPYPVSEVLELAVMDCLREQCKRRVEAIEPDEMKEGLERAKKAVEPLKS